MQNGLGVANHRSVEVSKRLASAKEGGRRQTELTLL